MRRGGRRLGFAAAGSRGIDNAANRSRRGGISNHHGGRPDDCTTMLLGHHLDLASPVAAQAIVPERRTEADRYLGVRFECCGVYSRVYRNKTGSAYVGHCPKCAARVQFDVSPDGSDSRFFSVS